MKNRSGSHDGGLGSVRHDLVWMVESSALIVWR
jgi:hypothetical protein